MVETSATAQIEDWLSQAPRIPPSKKLMPRRVVQFLAKVWTMIARKSDEHTRAEARRDALQLLVELSVCHSEELSVALQRSSAPRSAPEKATSITDSLRCIIQCTMRGARCNYLLTIEKNEKGALYQFLTKQKTPTHVAKPLATNADHIANACDQLAATYC